jgi:hypothetical protein
MQPNRNGPQAPSWPAPGWCIEPVAFSSSTQECRDCRVLFNETSNPSSSREQSRELVRKLWLRRPPVTRRSAVCHNRDLHLKPPTSPRGFRPPDSARTFSSRFHLTATSKGKISAATPLFCFVQNSLQVLGADAPLFPNFSRRPRAYYHQRRHHIGFRSDRIAVSSQIDNNRYAYFAISERLFEAHFLRGRKNAR